MCGPIPVAVAGVAPTPKFQLYVTIGTAANRFDPVKVTPLIQPSEEKLIPGKGLEFTLIVTASKASQDPIVPFTV